MRGGGVARRRGRTWKDGHRAPPQCRSCTSPSLGSRLIEHVGSAQDGEYGRQFGGVKWRGYPTETQGSPTTWATVPGNHTSLPRDDTGARAAAGGRPGSVNRETSGRSISACLSAAIYSAWSAAGGAAPATLACAGGRPSHRAASSSSLGSVSGGRASKARTPFGGPDSKPWSIIGVPGRRRRRGAPPSGSSAHQAPPRQDSGTELPTG